MEDEKKVRRSASGRRDIQLRVCVTRRERKILQAAADAAHLPLTTWLRSVGLRAAEGSKRQTPSEDGKMKYRKLKDENVWHWSKKCSEWPDHDYDVSFARPLSGEACEECKKKEPAGDFSH